MGGQCQPHRGTALAGRLSSWDAPTVIVVLSHKRFRVIIGFGQPAASPRASDTSTCQRPATKPRESVVYVRSDLKPARISSLRNFGCSNAAKCPPLGSLL